MVMKPQQTLSDEDQKRLEKILHEVDDLIQRDGQVLSLDTRYPSDGKHVGDHIWDALIRRYRDEGWRVGRRGATIKILRHRP